MKRTIKPAAGDSHVSAEDARNAARLVYRDGTTGRFVIVEREGSTVAMRRTKRKVGERSYPRVVARPQRNSSSHPSSHRADAKKR